MKASEDQEDCPLPPPVPLNSSSSRPLTDPLPCSPSTAASSKTVTLHSVGAKDPPITSITSLDAITPTATHPFFLSLHTRPRYQRRFFQRNFPPCARMCKCDMFPVHAEKHVFPSSSAAPPLHSVFAPFCLSCIRLLCGAADFTQDEYWTDQLDKEWEDHYSRSYTVEEWSAMNQTMQDLRAARRTSTDTPVGLRVAVKAVN